MSKCHEERKATIESAVLKTSQDRDFHLPVQSIESSFAAFSESWLDRKRLTWQKSTIAVDSFENYDPVVERAAVQLRS